MDDDRAFATAIERAYLSIMNEVQPQGEAELTLHQEILDRAIYRADPTSGGLRYKRLVNAEEIEDRLLKALRNHLA